MKTRHIFYLISVVAILFLTISVLDYRSKYLDLNSQYETLKKQKGANEGYVSDLHAYAVKVKNAYDSLYGQYSELNRELASLKDSLQSISSSKVAKIKDPSKQVNKLLSLMNENQSEIKSLQTKLDQVQNTCSQPIVRIIESPNMRLPATESQPDLSKE